METGVIIAAISAVSAAFLALCTAVLTYLAGRDKLKFDARMLELEKLVLRCEEERKENKQRAGEAVAKTEKVQSISDRMEGELKGLERELVNVRGEVRELRDRLYGGAK